MNPSRLLEEQAQIIGLPRSIQTLLHSHINRPKRDTSLYPEDVESFEGRSSGYSQGCNDPFSAFAFLVFLLALLNLIMNMGMAKRKKRHVFEDDSEEDLNKLRHNSQVREAGLAIYSMLRGYLNTMSALENEADDHLWSSKYLDGSQCAELFFCEGALEAAKKGSIGHVIAKIGSSNGAYHLRALSTFAGQDFESAGLFGAHLGITEMMHTSNQTCSDLFRCSQINEALPWHRDSPLLFNRSPRAIEVRKQRNEMISLSIRMPLDSNYTKL